MRRASGMSLKKGGGFSKLLQCVDCLSMLLAESQPERARTTEYTWSYTGVSVVALMVKNGNRGL